MNAAADIRTLRRIGAALWLLLLASLAGAAVWLVLRVHTGAQRQLDGIEPRFARLLGLIDQRAALEAAATAAGTELARHSYPATRDASQAGNQIPVYLRDASGKISQVSQPIALNKGNFAQFITGSVYRCPSYSSSYCNWRNNLKPWRDNAVNSGGPGPIRQNYHRHSLVKSLTNKSPGGRSHKPHHSILPALNKASIYRCIHPSKSSTPLCGAQI